MFRRLAFSRDKFHESGPKGDVLDLLSAVEIHSVLVGTKCNWTSVLVLHLKSKLSFSYAETIWGHPSFGAKASWWVELLFCFTIYCFHFPKVGVCNYALGGNSHFCNKRWGGFNLFINHVSVLSWISCVWWHWLLTPVTPVSGLLQRFWIIWPVLQ